jgi:polysaccharide export outer membrane protein
VGQAPIQLADGSYYQLFTYVGRYYVDRASFRHYPFMTISLPLVNSIDLRGRTARQAEEVIRAAYDRDYLVNPQVSVIVVKYAERSVNVVGQVNNAGRVLFPQEKGLTIVEAIALAGGQTRLADLKKVRLTRKTADGETVVEEIDVDALMKRGGRDAVQLQRDDVLFVPERAF